MLGLSSFSLLIAIIVIVLLVSMLGKIFMEKDNPIGLVIMGIAAMLIIAYIL